MCVYNIPQSNEQQRIMCKWLQGYGENVPFLCNVLTYCGFPEGDQTRQTEVGAILQDVCADRSNKCTKPRTQ